MRRLPDSALRVEASGFGCTNAPSTIFCRKRAVKAESGSPISERILYATGDDTLASCFEIPTVQVLSALRLPPEFRMSASQNEAAATPTYLLTSSLHQAVHDKSDESLLNDYEQLSCRSPRERRSLYFDLF